MIEFNDLPIEIQQQYANKPLPEELSKIDHISKEIARKEQELFERRVEAILERHGLLVLPTKDEEAKDEH